MSGEASSTSGPAAAAGPLKRTPLHGLHGMLGARMVPFAGYEMPVQFAPGVLKEHIHTRAAASLFDVSHMGQIAVWPRSGRVADAAVALERIVPADVLGLGEGRQRYGFITNDQGGILDDLMVAHRGDHFLLVVNAARKEEDLRHLTSLLDHDCRIELLERALIALQGPAAEAALVRLAPGAIAMRFMDVRTLDIMGSPCTVVRAGYTGEDGFEISTPADVAREVAEGLLEDNNVQPAGLGARDSLRLEAGLCLYGADIDATTTPIEANLAWAIPSVRRTGGARAGGFPGSHVVLAQATCGTTRLRVGLKPEGRAPVRAGAPIFAEEAGGAPVGTVTSGGFGPSLDAPVAMGYVPSSMSAAGTRVFAEVRGKRLAATVAALPFIPTHYKRGAGR